MIDEMSISVPPSKLSRRQWLQAAAVSAGAPAILRAQAGSVPTLGLTIQPSQEILKIPANFTGLSYEAGQLASADFFAPANTALAGLMRRLGSKGVLRIGGNSSEYSMWSPDGNAPVVPATVVSPDTGGKTHRITTIKPEAVRNLAAFTKSCGWQLIYGVNLGNGAPDRAASEAQAVCEAAGDSLLAIQIGNEADLYHKNGLRPENWAFDDYLAQWREFATAIRKRVPHVPLAGPDVASNVAWIASFAEKAKDEVVFLSGHYYAMGPPTNPAMNISRMLKSSGSLQKNVPLIMQASHQSGRPYRMTEGNSCYNGGKAGASDTFASALWCGDCMLSMAHSGFIGVNLHGGGNGVYTPIAGDAQRGFLARPVYYGMLLAGQFAGTTMVAAELEAQNLNATAYAARVHNGLQIAIFNKEEQQAIKVNVNPSVAGRNAVIWRLSAPALDSKSEVTLAGAGVGADGTWAASKEENVAQKNGRFGLDIPAASAVLISLR
jgi:hypothetical protein